MIEKLEELLNLTAVIKIKQRTVTPLYYVEGLTVFVNYTNRPGIPVKVVGVVG